MKKPRALTKEEQELFNHWDYNPVVNSPDDSSQNYENIPERKKDHSNSDSSDSSSKEDKVNNDEEVDDPPINTFPKQNIKLNDQNDIKTDRTDKKTHKNKNNGSEKSKNIKHQKSKELDPDDSKNQTPKKDPPKSPTKNRPTKRIYKINQDCIYTVDNKPPLILQIPNPNVFYLTY